jgi:hypothetical protein
MLAFGKLSVSTTMLEGVRIPLLELTVTVRSPKRKSEA